uniref:Uncharacterized protein n=1 Tax=Romanomermis culicivorax TaxID=13658 RepID=A0A915K237_ROMCU
MIANLAKRFPETFENKQKEEDWKEAYETQEICNNTSALYFMMRGEATATHKLAEEQASGDFFCPPNISNCDAEIKPLPRGWYMWIDKKVKTPKKKKVCNKDEEPENFLDLYHFLVVKSFRKTIEMKDIKDGKVRQGIAPLSNNIREQNIAPRDHCRNQPIDQEQPQEIIIANPPIAITPAIGSEDVICVEKLIEVIETVEKRSTALDILMDAIKIMKEKIETLEKDHYGKEAVELVKKIQTNNEEDESTSEEQDVEVVLEAASEEDDYLEANTFPVPAI